MSKYFSPGRTTPLSVKSDMDGKNPAENDAICFGLFLVRCQTWVENIWGPAKCLCICHTGSDVRDNIWMHIYLLCLPQMSRQYFWPLHDVWNGFQKMNAECCLLYVSWSKYIKLVLGRSQACWKINIYKYSSTENTRRTMRYKIIHNLILFIIFILNVMIVLPAEDKPGLPEIASDDRRMNVSLFCYYHCN